MMTVGDFRCTRYRSLNRTRLAVHRVATACHLPRTQPLPQGHTAPGPQLVVDTQGLLLAVAVHPADLQDRDEARLVLARLKHRFPRLQQLWADAAYAGPKLGTWVQAATDWTLAIVRHPQPGAGFQVLPRLREFFYCTG